VLESLSKARDKLLEIGFDQQDLEQFEVSFFDNKIKDLAKVYSGYKLDDLENDLKSYNSDVRVINAVVQIAYRFSYKIDESKGSISFKNDQNDDLIKLFDEFRREYERMCKINDSKEFFAVKNTYTSHHTDYMSDPKSFF